jgi:hypothetical protein
MYRGGTNTTYFRSAPSGDLIVFETQPFGSLGLAGLVACLAFRLVGFACRLIGSSAEAATAAHRIDARMAPGNTARK